MSIGAKGRNFASFPRAKVCQNQPGKGDYCQIILSETVIYGTIALRTRRGDYPWQILIFLLIFEENIRKIRQ
jgi:hypothetical protein